jgi:hypothetical protein
MTLRDETCCVNTGLGVGEDSSNGQSSTLAAYLLGVRTEWDSRGYREMANLRRL